MRPTGWTCSEYPIEHHCCGHPSGSKAVLLRAAVEFSAEGPVSAELLNCPDGRVSTIAFHWQNTASDYRAHSCTRLVSSLRHLRTRRTARVGWDAENVLSEI